MISTPIVDISATLDQHKHIITGGGSVMKHCSSIFDTNATVMYIPTGVVANGPIQIEALLAEFSRQAHSIQNEQILSRTVSSNQIVEESLLTIIHKDTVTWLLPQVRPTGKEINVAMITVFEFNEAGKILSKRVYWDQASVLRQIGVLPKSLYCRSNSSEVTLPIVGAEIASNLYSTPDQSTEATTASEAIETTSEEETVNKRLNPKRNQSENIFSSEPVPFRPSSRVLSRPGGNTSDIFGLSAPEPQVQKAHLPVPGGPALNIFTDAPADAIVTEINRRDPNYTNNEEMQHRSSRSCHVDSNKSHFSLGENGDDTADQEKTSARRQLPRSLQTSFSFIEDAAPAPQKQTVRRDPNAQSQEAVHRPSSRVLSRPGGKQNFSFA